MKAVPEWLAKRRRSHELRAAKFFQDYDARLAAGEIAREIEIAVQAAERQRLSAPQQERPQAGVDYAALRLKRQESRLGRRKPDCCDVCGAGPVVFDHCHSTGRARGWLCGGCNLALGFAKDDATRLVNLAAYLVKP